MSRGKFIAVEGIDGAGKRTQLDLLSRALDQRGIAHQRWSFPQYDSFFGRLVGQYLNGEFGEVDAHLSALLYAGDRLEAKPKLETILASGRSIITDRYIGSNLAHQTARAKPESRDAFLTWLKRLEYEVYGLPREDLVVYLRLPAAQAQQLVGRKAARDYTNLKRDMHEADLRHLEDAARVYDQLAREPHWATVECFDTARGAVRTPEEIHRDVMGTIEGLGIKG